MSAAAGRQERLRELQRTLQKSLRPAVETQIIPTGLAAVDRLLPAGGLPVGTLIEWISADDGVGACSLALRCARPFLRQSGCLAVVDDDNSFNPDCLLQHSIPLRRLLLIRPQTECGQISPAAAWAAENSHRSLVRAISMSADGLWALEQAARCAGVRVVLCRLDRVSSTVLRRLQLAVERSGATLFLIRPASVLTQPSWADLRVLVAPAAATSTTSDSRCRRIDVSIVRARHAVISRGHTRLKIDHETGAVSEVSELAGAAGAATV